MSTPAALAQPAARALAVVRDRIGAGTSANKCHGCGCFQQTVRALAATELGQSELGPLLAQAEATFVPKKYDCLGCAVCFPADAANAFAEAFPGAGEITDLCPTEAPVERAGWPPLPGDYRVLRYSAPVAVCTLNTPALTATLASLASDDLAIVGTMHTENLGIERLIANVVANPNIRFLVLCGEDTEQAVGHLPGQSLQSLVELGVDETGRIRGARGKRPVLKNVARDTIEAFRRQIELVSLLGERDAERIVDEIRRCGARTPGPVVDPHVTTGCEPIDAREPTRLVPDPARYFVVYPDRRQRRLRLEHFTNAGAFTSVLVGATPAALYGEAVERRLVTRLDHAAYLGRELARAERALETGDDYVQDRAAGELMTEPDIARSLQPTDLAARLDVSAPAEARALVDELPGGGAAPAACGCGTACGGGR